jgi:ribosomal protein S27AE
MKLIFRDLNDMSDKFKTHQVLPLNTKAFTCTKCGAVSLSSDGVCEVMGTATRADWCGSENTYPEHKCIKGIHNERYKCGKCGQVSINPGLLCEPVKMEKE